MNDTVSNNPDPHCLRRTVIALPDDGTDTAWLDTGNGPGVEVKLPSVSRGTAHKNVRIDPELWDRAKWIFETRGTTISAELRDFLQRVVDEYERDQQDAQ